jgi:hypothetical protein
MRLASSRITCHQGAVGGKGSLVCGGGGEGGDDEEEEVEDVDDSCGGTGCRRQTRRYGRIH